MKHITIGLPTIHCESCIKLIGMTLKTISGIESKQFDLEERKLSLETDSTVSGEAIARAIREDAEYEAIVESEETIVEAPEPPTPAAPETPHPVVPIMPREMHSSITTLSIEGMHCSSCSALIEKSLRRVSGVEEAQVNFASEKARI